MPQVVLSNTEVSKLDDHSNDKQQVVLGKEANNPVPYEALILRFEVIMGSSAPSVAPFEKSCDANEQ